MEMPSWLIRLRDVIWSAVLSVVLSASAVLVAIFNPSAVALTIALGSASIVMALLSQKE